MLNQVLTGEAHSILTTTRSGGGIEVWRAITSRLTDKGHHRRQALLSRINSPKKTRKFSDVLGVLREWERDLEEYHLGGGTDYKSDECRMALLRQMLPAGADGNMAYQEFMDGAPRYSRRNVLATQGSSRVVCDSGAESQAATHRSLDGGRRGGYQVGSFSGIERRDHRGRCRRQSGM